MTGKCLICGGEKLIELIGLTKQPLARYGLSATRELAQQVSKFPICLVRCSNCGLVFNVSFNPNSVDYSNDVVLESRVFSDSIRKYMIETSHRLATDTGINSIENATILEIGCGEGFFLSQFMPNSNLFGYEPSPEGYVAEKLGIKIIHKYFDLNEYELPIPRLIILRQVLEHLADPGKMLRDIKNLLAKADHEAFLYLEVPNSRKTIVEDRFCDFYYEHVTYYTISTLTRLLESRGFAVVSVREAFSAEIIELLAIPVKDADLGKDKFESWKMRTRKRIEEYKAEGKTVIGWGTAGNGSALLNYCQITLELVSYIVDSDVRKQGMFIPGTGQLVISPKEMIAINPNVVFITSQLHKRDIEENIRGLLGNEVDIITFA